MMYKNYLKIALRNIRKQRIPSSLNIAGLALGIASTLLVVLHVKQELSYENSFEQADNVYRVSYEDWAKSSPPLKEFLQSHLPGAKLVSQIAAFGNEVVRTEHYKAEVANGYYADEEFFNMLGLKFIGGHPGEALQAPFKVVLTESMAIQFFGNKDPRGNVMLFNDKWDYEVIGVVEDLPKNSHFKIDYFVTMPTFYKQRPSSWTSNRNWMVTYTYALFDDQLEAGLMHSKLHDLSYEFFPDDPKEDIDRERAHFRAYPIKSIHLHSHKEQEMNANSDISYVYIFSALAIFIILIACVNFINIFITQATRRSKEIGVRKTLGAQRRQLVFQFLSESFITTLLASVIGVLIALAVLPAYNQWVSLPLSYEDLLTNTNLFTLVVLVLIVGFFAGLYPAFYISSQGSLAILKSQKAPRSSGAIVRKALVVIQFAISIIMLTGTLILFLQLNYIHTKDLGFNKDQLAGIKLYGEFRNYVRQNWETFHSELTGNTGILNASLASDLVGDRLSMEYITPLGSDPNEDHPAVRMMRVDENYLQTMAIPLLEGRDFMAKRDTSIAFIVNQRAAEALGLDNPIGTIVENQTRQVKGEIVGIIDDFHFSSLHEPVEPLVLSYRPGWTHRLLVKLDGSNLTGALRQVETEIKMVAPAALFDYEFLDTKLENLYQAEENVSKVVNAFSLLAIFISGLGLYGLMAYATEVRVKEIGIRKVLGASALKIVLILTSDLAKLITLALVFAIPVSYLLLQNWLDQFAFRISLAWWMFAGVGLATVFFALLTIGSQALKAAHANPVESLRDE